MCHSFCDRDGRRKYAPNPETFLCRLDGTTEERKGTRPIVSVAMTARHPNAHRSRRRDAGIVDVPGGRSIVDALAGKFGHGRSRNEKGRWKYVQRPTGLKIDCL